MSHFRGLLLALLLKDLSTESACQLATVAESTLFAARREYQYGQLGDLAQAYASHVHRERTPAEELADMSALIKDECPPKSGTRRVHWDQLDSDKQLREKYRTEYASSLVKLVENARNKTEMSPALRTLLSKFRDHEKKFAFLSFVHSAPSASEAFAGGSQHGPASIVLEYLDDVQSSAPAQRSAQVFEREKAKLPLSKRHAYWGKFDCKTCANGHNAASTISRLEASGTLSDAQQRQLTKARVVLAKYEWHKKVVESQRDAFQQLKALLPQGHALVLLDSHRITCNRTFLMLTTLLFVRWCLSLNSLVATACTLMS